MGADLIKRRLPRGLDRGHADTELALSRLRNDLQTQAYAPAIPGNWNDPPPTTVQEALDRLAAANPGA